MNLLHLPAVPPTASTPDPSPSPTLPEEIEEAGDAFWTWFTGWPLRVLIIVVVGIVVLVLLRRVISHVTERIATGVPRAQEKGWKDWFRRSPIVGDALVMANPLASARRAQRARTVGSVLNSTANIVVGVLILLMVLTEIGYPVGPLLASAGVAGIALGFGAQSLVKDFISGIFILIEDQYGVGDVVDLGSGAEGVIEEVQLRTTQVRSIDGTLWWVRNGEILRAGNRTQGWSRALAEVRVPVDADVDVVRAALGRAADAVAADPEWADEFLEPPSVRGVDAVTDFSMSFTLHAQVKPGMQWDVSRAMLRAAQAQLRGVKVLRTDAVESGEG
ncbi:mechanosensitive ion channel family protein [Isoptericola sp. S6320L]|uniref:mechanosensitive ion channel family protein n=1 Tax=Isoptericola sp. S6320L TaxID=2926411 RepID=UPI001FF64814|nr:mechanosensitive ion channel domain-containing protein [Isoptericola sp. S6320L]MCK0118848.1 mechanosensitive ion channel family protein [Isoptericola sp. S6320L]